MLGPEILYLTILTGIVAVHLSNGQTCPAPLPLGLKDGTIIDSQITASGSFGGNYSPPNCRLDGPTAWFCLDCDSSAWLQVDFLACAMVTGIIMQGRADGQWDEYVNKYSIEYRLDEADPLVYITDADGVTPTVYPGPTDGPTKVPSTFATPIITRYIRIRPIEWHQRAFAGLNDWMSLRMELIGCQDTPELSPTPPGVITQNTDPGMATASVTWTIDAAATYCPTAPITLTANKQPGDLFPIGTTEVDYTASAGSVESTFSFSVTINDVEIPVFNPAPPAEIVQGTDAGLSTAVVNWVITVTDNSGVNPVVTSSHNPGDTFPIGRTPVSYNANDKAGNSATYAFDVVVEDQELPIFQNVPADFSQNNDPGQATAVVTWVEPTATDNIGLASLISDHQPGDQFSIGLTTVTYTATDVNNNVATASFVVDVKDVESPVIVYSPPAEIRQNTDPNSPTAVVTWIEPTVTDNSGASGITVSSNHQSGDSFVIGTTTVTYNVVDKYANSDTVSFDVIITDVEIPIFAVFPQLELYQDADHGGVTTSVSWPEPIITDNSGIPPVVTSDIASGHTFSIGKTPVTYNAVDGSGNTATYTFDVIVKDAEPPVINNTPENITDNNDPDRPYAIITWTEPTSTDNTGIVSMTSNYQPGDKFYIGETNVTYTAVDEAGNTAIDSFVITIIDAIGPTIVLVFPHVTDPGDPYATVTWMDPLVEDNSGTFTVSVDFESGHEFPIGKTNVTYTAVDPGGNLATVPFVIEVVDKENPVITAIENVDHDVDTRSGRVFWVEPGVSDNSGTVSMVSDFAPGDEFFIGKTKVTYTATDPYGNTKIYVLIVTVYGTFGQFAKDYRMALQSFKNETYYNVTSSDVMTAWDNMTSVLPDTNDERQTDLYKFEVIEWRAGSDIEDSISLDGFTHFVTIPNGALNITDRKKGKCLIVAAKELHGLAEFEFDFQNGLYVLASSVVSVTLFDEDDNEINFEESRYPVQLNIQLKESVGVPKPCDESYSPGVLVCAFWNIEGYWSEEGCRAVDSNATYLTCECIHLTTFAALFRFSEKPPLQYSAVMKALFKFLTILSVAALILGLMILVYLWKKSGLHKDRSLININLMISMMLVLVLLLVSDPAEANEITCLVITILLHYSLLAMFCWMSVEAIHLYRMIIVVFGAEKDLKLVYLAIGWGVPMLITAITAGVGRKDLEDFEEPGCWLAVKGGYVWAFLAPVILIILVNTIILVLVMYKTMKAASIEKDKKKLIKSGVKCLVLLLPLLGVIWIAGFVANQHIVVAYLFEIMSALQGVYLVAVTCFVSSEVRDVMKREINKLSGRIGNENNHTRMTSHSAVTETLAVADLETPVD